MAKKATEAKPIEVTGVKEKKYRIAEFAGMFEIQVYDWEYHSIFPVKVWKWRISNIYGNFYVGKPDSYLTKYKHLEEARKKMAEFQKGITYHY